MCSADHTGLEAQGVADGSVNISRGIVTHGEVVAVGVAHLMRRDGLREREDTPVGDAADDTAVAEDESTDSRGDSTATS